MLCLGSDSHAIIDPFEEARKAGYVGGYSQLKAYVRSVRPQPAPEPVQRFKAAVAGVDALLFVTPEYNRSIPGGLKNAIDWASRPAYQSVFRGKPCFVISVSGGALGGAPGGV